MARRKITAGCLSLAYSGEVDPSMREISHSDRNEHDASLACVACPCCAWCTAVDRSAPTCCECREWRAAMTTMRANVLHLEELFASSPDSLWRVGKIHRLTCRMVTDRMTVLRAELRDKCQHFWTYSGYVASIDDLKLVTEVLAMELKKPCKLCAPDLSGLPVVKQLHRTPPSGMCRHPHGH